MKKYITTNIGRLRAIAFLEGLSLILLLAVAMPLKYMAGEPRASQAIGMAHGLLFLLFVFYTINVAVELRWKFRVTFIVLLASFIPFGTFYIDHKILKPAAESAS